MKNNGIKYFGIILFVLFIASAVFSQPRYRTFSQSDLSLKKAKAGKVLSSNVCFVFRNDSTGMTVNGLTARFNSAVLAILDSGGFSSIEILQKNKVIHATGRSIAAGDSVTLCFKLEKKAPGAQTNYWWWETDNLEAGGKRSELNGTYEPVATEPNGGNVLEHIYKRVIHRPEGLVVGMVSDTPDVGWIRYMKADRKYFPHFGAPRCFDVIATGSARTKDFDAQLRNPHVRKHDNHLLGEVHALKLAIIASDSGVTEPLDTTALGDLIYNDLSNPGDPCNGFTLREIVMHIDSALTYCSHFANNPDIYNDFDYCVTRINQAFDGEYRAISLMPFVLAGTKDLDDVPFIHPNPGMAPVTARRSGYSIESVPDNSSLKQNYPNPFNPATTIDFTLAEPSLVTLKIYNLLGQEVASLIDREIVDDGDQSVEFNAGMLPSGIYLYKITAQGIGESAKLFQSVNKMILLK